MLEDVLGMWKVCVATLHVLAAILCFRTMKYCVRNFRSFRPPPPSDYLRSFFPTFCRFVALLLLLLVLFLFSPFHVKH